MYRILEGYLIWHSYVYIAHKNMLFFQKRQFDVDVVFSSVFWNRKIINVPSLHTCKPSTESAYNYDPLWGTV